MHLKSLAYITSPQPGLDGVLLFSMQSRVTAKLLLGILLCKQIGYNMCFNERVLSHMTQMTVTAHEDCDISIPKYPGWDAAVLDPFFETTHEPGILVVFRPGKLDFR